LREQGLGMIYIPRELGAPSSNERSAPSSETCGARPEVPACLRTHECESGLESKRQNADPWAIVGLRWAVDCYPPPARPRKRFDDVLTRGVLLRGCGSMTDVVCLRKGEVEAWACLYTLLPSHSRAYSQKSSSDRHRVGISFVVLQGAMSSWRGGSITGQHLGT
jgi:hypothetical protein